MYACRERLAVVALCAGYALGLFGPNAALIWVPASVKRGVFDLSKIGWLASGELFLIALSTLVASIWAPRIKPRTVATRAASLMVIGNLIAMIPESSAFIAGRLLSGVGTGLLLSVVTGIAARGGSAQRVLALMQGSAVLLNGAVYFLSPGLVNRYGPAGLFGIIAIIAAFAGLVARLGLSNIVYPSKAVVHSDASSSALAPLLGCFAWAVAAVGMNAVWIYMMAIGDRRGFDTHIMGRVLAAAGLLAVLGPVLAHRVGNRFGPELPLLVALLVVAADFFFIVNATSPLQLAVYTALLLMIGGFFTPYAITSISRADRSGRFASAAPAFAMIGAAVAPKLGSAVLAANRFDLLAAVAAICVAVSIALFAVSSNNGAARGSKSVHL